MCRYCSFSIPKQFCCRCWTAPTCRKRMAFCIARCYLRRHSCKHLSPPANAPKQPAKQYPNRQEAFFGGASQPVPSCFNRHDPVDYVIIFIIIVTIIMFSDLPQPRVWSKRLRIRSWSRHSG